MIPHFIHLWAIHLRRATRQNSFMRMKYVKVHFVKLFFDFLTLWVVSICEWQMNWGVNRFVRDIGIQTESNLWFLTVKKTAAVIIYSFFFFEKRSWQNASRMEKKCDGVHLKDVQLHSRHRYCQQHTICSSCTVLLFFSSSEFWVDNNIFAFYCHA